MIGCAESGNLSYRTRPPPIPSPRPNRVRSRLPGRPFMLSETIMDVHFKDVLAFAVAQWRRTPRAVALAGGLMFGATMAEIFTPVAIGRLVDALGDARADPGQAVEALSYVIGLGILFQVLQKSGDYAWAGIEMGIMRRIGADAFAHVQRFASDWHADTFAGSTVRNITRGVWAFDMFGDAIYFHLGPSAAVTIGGGGPDAVALAADGAGLSRRRPALHCGLGPTVAGLCGATPPRRRRQRQPARRGAGRCTDLQRGRQEHGGGGARGRPAGRGARPLAGKHGARLVRLDPHRRGAERPADCPAGGAGGRRLVAVVARPGQCRRRRLRAHQLPPGQPLAARCRHAAARRPAGGQRHGAPDRIPPHPATVVDRTDARPLP